MKSESQTETPHAAQTPSAGQSQRVPVTFGPDSASGGAGRACDNAGFRSRVNKAAPVSHCDRNDNTDWLPARTDRVLDIRAEPRVMRERETTNYKHTGMFRVLSLSDVAPKISRDEQRQLALDSALADQLAARAVERHLAANPVADTDTDGEGLILQNRF